MVPAHFQPLIDFDALYDAMKSDKVCGAGLDCLPEEPPVTIPKLLQAYRDRESWLNGRMIVTSHVAYWSPQAEAVSGCLSIVLCCLES
jgi:phosphoglycerate dehydrogenase-like enzyme